MKILVTGAGGYFAARFREYYQNHYEIIGMQHKEMDITDWEQTKTIVERIRPDLVVHSAAVSDVKTCADDPEFSFRVNKEGAENIAGACQRIGSKMIFCSSDQVYHKSTVSGPHLETEEVNPPHPYGRQKLQAEQGCMEIAPDTVCLRLSMMYAADGRKRKEHNNLFRILSDAIRERKPVRFSPYDYRSITNVWDVVKAMEQIFDLPGGVYNLGSSNTLSVYETIRKLLEGSEALQLLECDRQSFSDTPRNLTMNVDKIGGFGIVLPETLEGLLANRTYLF